jgi:diguanylate cyclase (GGDEF)-like protein
MESWMEISDRLRSRYVVGTAWTLDRVAVLLDRLAEHPGTRQARQAVDDLRRCFQGIARSGGSYGFAGLAASSGEGERACAALLRAGTLPESGQLETWRGLLRAMCEELAAAAQPEQSALPGCRLTRDPGQPPEVGRGSRPPAPTSARAAAGEIQPQPPAALENRPRILYMDDSRLQASYVRSVLEAAGYLVRCCTDPHCFMDELATFRPALVLMDCLLPGVSGYELVRLLRREERFAALPVIFMTTEDRVQARIETVRAGGDDHLVKPVAPPLLLAAVEARLERGGRLHQLLTRDGLTQLLTHTAILERARELAERQRHDPRRRATWVMIDLDRFKSINDRFGHPVGDRVLTAVAAHLSANLRASDSIGRCGGEEFALLLDGSSELEACSLTERLREEFGELQHDIGDGLIRVTFSAGIAMLRPGMSLDQWRSAADLALYAAKEAGRNRVAVARLDPAARDEAAVAEGAYGEAAAAVVN